MRSTTTTISVFFLLSYIIPSCCYICYHELPLSSALRVAVSVATVFFSSAVALGTAIKKTCVISCDSCVIK